MYQCRYCGQEIVDFNHHCIEKIENPELWDTQKEKEKNEKKNERR